MNKKYEIVKIHICSFLKTGGLDTHISDIFASK